MPTLPEFRYRPGIIRSLKILHQAEAQNASSADGDVRVAGEIAVNLIGEKESAYGKLQSVVSPRRCINVIDVKGEPVGDDQFFEETPGHSFESAGDAVIIKWMNLAKLMDKVLRALDRAGDELREKHDVRGIGYEVVFGFLPAAIDFHDIAQALERMKGEANRQDDARRGERRLPTEQFGD